MRLPLIIPLLTKKAAPIFLSSSICMILLEIVWFQNVSIPLPPPPPPYRRLLAIPRGREVLEAKLLEEMHEAKLEFPRGGGG